MPAEIQPQDFGSNVSKGAVSACIATANSERSELKLTQNLSTAFNLVLVIVGVMGSVAAAFIDSPKRRRQVGAAFAGLTIIVGAVPAAFEDPQKLRDSFGQRKRLWDEAVTAEQQLVELTSAVVAAGHLPNMNAEALKKAKTDVMKLSWHVKDVLDRCDNSDPGELPPRPTPSEEVFALASELDEVKVAVNVEIAEDKLAPPVVGAGLGSGSGAPRRTSRRAFKVAVEKNAGMLEERNALINSIPDNGL